MPLSFWDYVRLGSPQWRGQVGFARQAIWFLLGTPDIHTRIRNAHVCNVVERLALSHETRILDTGCGRAVSLFYLAKKYPRYQLTGLELDDEMIEPSKHAAVAGDFGNVEFIQCSVNDLVDENTYDLALCMEILEHVPDDVGLLRKISRALRPGGYLIVTAPLRRQQQWRWLRSFTRHDVKGEFGHVRNEYLEEELRLILDKAGFQIREFHQTVGKLAEVAFELNNLFWESPSIRRFMAILTYPLVLPLGYWDLLRYQKFGNSFLILAQRK